MKTHGEKPDREGKALTAALAAVAAALGTLVLTLLVVRLTRREPERPDEEKWAESLRGLEARLDAIDRELTRALEYSESDSRRTKIGDLAERTGAVLSSSRDSDPDRPPAPDRSGHARQPRLPERGP